MTWPKLSATLPHRNPGECQMCRSTVDLTHWQECDDVDSGTHQVVVLCKRCAEEVIEPHPRLYVLLAEWTPMPGAMLLCLDCRCRTGLECHSAEAKFNGGPGLTFEPRGRVIHVCRSPRSKSGWLWLADGPVTKCSGKEGIETS